MRIWIAQSLRAKVVALAVAAVACTAAAFAVRNSHQTERLMGAAVLADLERIARLGAQAIGAQLEAMRQDGALLANMPPIRDLVRNREAPDGAGDAAAGLAQIFEGMLEARPVYGRILYVGLADGRRDLLQIVRDAAAIRRVTEDADPLDPVLEAPLDGGAAFVQTTAGRDGEAARRIALIQPLHGAGGAVRGAIVIEAEFERLLDRARPGPSDVHLLTVLGGDAEGRSYAVAAAGSRFELHAGAGPPVFLAGLLPDEDLVGSAETATGLAFAVPVRVGSGAGSLDLRVVASAPESALSAGARAALYRDLGLSAVLGLLIAGAAGAFGARLTRPLEALAAALRHPDHRGPAIVAHLGHRDEIGTLARAFEALRDDLVESMERLRAIHAAAPGGIITADESGTILDMNPAAEAMFGYEPGGALGRSVDTLMPEAQRDRGRAYLADVAGGRRRSSEGRRISGLRRNGETFPIGVEIDCAEVAGRKTIIAIAQDISDRVAAEDRQARLLAELERSRRELERSNAELDQFAYVASHDLKAPLRVIDNASRWLEEDLDGVLDADTRESLSLLRNRVRRMERLLDDLLAFARVGRTETGTETVTGEALIEHVLELAAPPPGFRVELEGPFGAIRVSRMPLALVLLNLVVNAIKHHDRAEGLVRISVCDRGERLAFAVEDDGPGIPPEHQERVFGMFQTLRPRDEVEGSGMGLALVRKTVALQNGTLTLRSGPGRGCLFRFDWPKSRAVADLEAA